MPESDTFSYTVRIVSYAGERTTALQDQRQVDDRASMEARGWQVVYSTHSLDHSTSLYRRPAALNSVYFMMPDGEIVGTTLD